jgi:protein phosphatase
MEHGNASGLCAHGASLLVSTDNKVIDLTDPKSESRHRMVNQADGSRRRRDDSRATGLHRTGPALDAQPAVKCRGPEYLRIIYGSEYTLPNNLDRLRFRGLWVKRSLALRLFALGVGALERFVRGEPLRRVYECLFAVLALQSASVDPRL